MHRRSIITLILLLVVTVALFVPLDEAALSLHEESLTRSVGAFALAKGLNAVISLLQGTEISASAGVGLTITVGELLDPMNDMVERFSWIMLAASVSLAIQELLLNIGELTWIKISLAAVALLFAASLWYAPLQRRLSTALMLRLAIILVILRFGAALFVYAEQQIYIHLMEPKYHHSVAVLQETEKELDTLATLNREEAKSSEEEGFFDSMSRTYDKAKSYFDFESRLESLGATIQEAQEQIIRLITIFVTLNILLPLLFAWIAISLFKWALVGRIDKEALHDWLYLRH